MNKTGIEWVRNPDGSPGYTCSPLTGCFGPNGTAEKPNRCLWCWAWGLAKGRLRERYLANPNVLAGDPADLFAIRWWWKRLYDIPLGGKPKGIFLVDMGDLFQREVPDEYVQAVLEITQKRPKYRFYVLTKNPKRLAEFNPWPDNVWVGATATDGETFIAACHALTNVDALVKYLSLEPLLSWPAADVVWPLAKAIVNEKVVELLQVAGVSWLIIGGLSLPGRRYQHPLPQWVADIEAAADKAGVAVFEKENIRSVGLPLRQEFPK